MSPRRILQSKNGASASDGPTLYCIVTAKSGRLLRRHAQQSARELKIDKTLRGRRGRVLVLRDSREHLHQRGLIRVDADEVTYPAHVILRYEIERPLIEGEIEPEDIPGLWDAKMAELLGLDTRGNYTDGPLQDVHWPEALFGYFPCYSLGAMYAAQWFAAMRRAMPDLDARIGAGELQGVFDWLRANIWSQGSRYTTDELAVRASGEPLNPAHFRAHLVSRYLPA